MNNSFDILQRSRAIRAPKVTSLQAFFGAKFTIFDGLAQIFSQFLQFLTKFTIFDGLAQIFLASCAQRHTENRLCGT